MNIHSRERMTVNHDVTGSSPVGGAKVARRTIVFRAIFYPVTVTVVEGDKPNRSRWRFSGREVESVQ